MIQTAFQLSELNCQLFVKLTDELFNGDLNAENARVENAELQRSGNKNVRTSGM